MKANLLYRQEITQPSQSVFRDGGNTGARRKAKPQSCQSIGVNGVKHLCLFNVFLKRDIGVCISRTDVFLAGIENLAPVPPELQSR